MYIFSFNTIRELWRNGIFSDGDLSLELLKEVKESIKQDKKNFKHSGICLYKRKY